MPRKNLKFQTKKRMIRAIDKNEMSAIASHFKLAGMKELYEIFKATILADGSITADKLLKLEQIIKYRELVLQERIESGGEKIEFKD